MRKHPRLAGAELNANCKQRLATACERFFSKDGGYELQGVGRY